MTKANILYVENDPEYLEYIQKLLEQDGYHVITASNPEDARTLLQNELFDLAILDLRLIDDKDETDRSGLLLAKEVDPQVPKIILSAVKDPDLIIEAFIGGKGGGAVNYLYKQVAAEKLSDAVRRAIQYRVFIVHGHDDAAKLAAVRFIEQIGLCPIVLSEQLGRGDTIIENFERYSNVPFAVVLLTPDDLGITQRDREPKTKPRARQNVIFELGYFIGKLGRKNVFALIKEDIEKGDIEIPSDFKSVLYTQMDEAGAWRYELADELEGAGIYVDRTKIKK